MGLNQTVERFKPENHGTHFLWRPMSKHFGNEKEILGALCGYNYGSPKEF
jgi:hypothetical protein